MIYWLAAARAIAVTTESTTDFMLNVYAAASLLKTADGSVSFWIIKLLLKKWNGFNLVNEAKHKHTCVYLLNFRYDQYYSTD